MCQFCQIPKWIRHRYTCIPHPEPSSLLPPHTLWVVPVHQPQASSIVHWTWTGNSFHTLYFTCFNAYLFYLKKKSVSILSLTRISFPDAGPFSWLSWNCLPCWHLEGFTTSTLLEHFYGSIKFFIFMSNIVNGEMMEDFEANQMSRN